MTLTRWGWFITPLSTLAGGAVLLLAANRVQETLRRFDRLCDNIRATGDLGAECWLTGKDESSRSVTEAKIVGQQLLISEAFADLGQHRDQSKKDEWVTLPDPFYDQLTGGEFMTRDRDPKPDTARLLQLEMARLVGQVRRGQAETLKFGRILSIAFNYAAPLP